MQKINDRNITKRQSNASAKSKEVQALAQSNTVAPHLPLRNRTTDYTNIQN